MVAARFVCGAWAKAATANNIVERNKRMTALQLGEKTEPALKFGPDAEKSVF
jgi:hypothetical protein